MLKTIPQLFVRSIKQGRCQSMKMECLRREMDFAHFIWPQQVSEVRKEAASSHREKRAEVPGAVRTWRALTADPPRLEASAAKRYFRSAMARALE